MSPTRLDVAFDSNFSPASSPQGFADLRQRLADGLARHAAGLEFALIVFWALSPFAFALLVS